MFTSSVSAGNNGKEGTFCLDVTPFPLYFFIIYAAKNIAPWNFFDIYSKTGYAIPSSRKGGEGVYCFDVFPSPPPATFLQILLNVWRKITHLGIILIYPAKQVFTPPSPFPHFQLVIMKRKGFIASVWPVPPFKSLFYVRRKTKHNGSLLIYTEK